MVHFHHLFLYALPKNLLIRPTARLQLEYQMLCLDLGPVESERKFWETVKPWNVIVIIINFLSLFFFFQGVLIPVFFSSVMLSSFLHRGLGLPRLSSPKISNSFTCYFLFFTLSELKYFCSRYGNRIYTWSIIKQQQGRIKNVSKVYQQEATLLQALKAFYSLKSHKSPMSSILQQKHRSTCCAPLLWWQSLQSSR